MIAIDIVMYRVV